MIFSIGNHIEQIRKGTKTQTRRTSSRYRVGRTYAIQPSRTAKGISEGRILITLKRLELRQDKISAKDAWAEGCYSTEGFEELYEQKYHNWRTRFAYTFKFVPTLKKDSVDKAQSLR